MADLINPEPVKSGSELSLAEILKELGRWKFIITRNLRWFILAGMLGVLGGGGYAYLNEPVYSARLNFVMRADAMGNVSSFSSITTLLGGGTNPNGSPLERIIELLGSERVVGNALLTEAEINGRKDLLINHFIELEELHKKWKKDSVLRKITFEPGADMDLLGFQHRRALKSITGKFITKEGDAIINKSYDKKSGVVTMSADYKNEAFAIVMVKAVYQELVDFYVNQSISTTHRNVEVLTDRVDSIRNALESTRQRYAVNSDQSLGLMLQQNKVENKTLAVNENLLTLIYGESLKNLETLRFVEATALPAFNIIDMPYSPIEPSKKSKIKFGVLGAFLCCALLFGFYRLRELRKTLRS